MGREVCRRRVDWGARVRTGRRRESDEGGEGEDETDSEHGKYSLDGGKEERWRTRVFCDKCSQHQLHTSIESQLVKTSIVVSPRAKLYFLYIRSEVDALGIIFIFILQAVQRSGIKKTKLFTLPLITIKSRDLILAFRYPNQVHPASYHKS